jgi:hypothetical protein
MWKVPSDLLIRIVPPTGSGYTLRPNKDKVVPRNAGSRYVLFTLDYRPQVHRGPSRRSCEAWEVTCGRDG